MTKDGQRRWYVTQYGDRAGDDAPRKIVLHDCTIREGEQQPGYELDDQRRLRVLHALDDLGVPQIEVGLPGRGPEYARKTKDIVKAGLRAKLTAVCRAQMDQVQPGVETGVWGLLCSVPADPLQLAHKAKIDEGQAIANAIEATKYAHDAGVYVILSAAYATRADLAFLSRMLREVTTHGWADRVRVVDSAGCAGPEAVAFLVKTFRQVTGKPVEVHCHDDFGLATANALAAVLAGADVVSCSVAGIGPRAGNSALEEVALGLDLLYGHSTDVDLAKLVATVRVVEEAFGIQLPPYKAISGPNLLVPSDIASVGMDADPLVSQAFLPSVVGHPAKVSR